MARPIPIRKKKAVSKKVDHTKELNKQLEIFKRATEARYELARGVFDAQPASTQEVIFRIQKMLLVNANGVVKFYPKNDRKQVAIPVTVEMEYVEHNAFYMAIEILKDLAMMDIRVDEFEFPETFCAECGIKLNDRGKGKKKRRG